MTKFLTFDVEISPETHQRLREIRLHAEQNPFTMDDQFDIRNNAEPPAGDRPEHRAEVPDGWRLVFSVEWQPLADGQTVRHLSLSHRSAERPPMPIIRFFAGLFGFSEDLEAVKAYVEEDSNVIHLLEPLEKV